MELFRTIARVLTRWQTTILLSFIYWLFVVPLGFMYRVVTKHMPGEWHSWSYRANTLDDLRKQF